jgi:protein gp37
MRANHPNEKISSRAKTVTLSPTCTPWNRKDGFQGNVVCREDNLDLPLRTKKPTVWAIWNDLYHEDVSDDFRDRAYAVMALCPQHTFLVLTKRAERMAEYWLSHCGIRNRTGGIDMIAFELDASLWEKSTISTERNGGFGNVWHGVTVENQAMADERIHYLRQVPGKRLLSLEPMLGPVDLSCYPYAPDVMRGGIHTVLLGGESGKNARPMHPDWVRSVRDQCAAASVPFFFKQWGEYFPTTSANFALSKCGWAYGEVPGLSMLRDGRQILRDIPGKLLQVVDISADIDLQKAMQAENIDPKNPDNYDWLGYQWMHRVGKKKAGRLLDGRLHDDLAWGKE